MTADLTLTVHLADPAVVSLDGELDLNSAPDLGAVLAALVARGHRRLVVDCRALRFIDASGLRVFAETHGRLTTLAGTFEVRDLGPLARRLVEITGMSGILGPPPRSIGDLRGFAEPIG